PPRHQLPHAAVDAAHAGLRLRRHRARPRRLPRGGGGALPLLQLRRRDVAPARGHMKFTVLARKGKARAGILETAHGTIETPIFMPVGTAGTVKGMTVGELAAPPLDAHIILGNTYHLYLRPGLDVVAAHGGLHRMIGWDRPILTDSGGFQVFSQGDNAKIDDDGVTFRSHIDGSSHRITPERSVEIQATLGSDIAMAFDECPPGGAPRETVERAMARTTRWAHRCLATPRASRQALFGILPGGADVRRL